MSRWTMADVVAAKDRMAKVASPYDPEAMQAQSRKLFRATAVLAKQKPSKYGNKKTNGYASAREARRAEELKLREAAGEIVGLQEQVTFELIPKQDGERSCKYIADFVYDEEYVDREDRNEVRTVVEDAKGYRDPVYRIKRKLMLKVHGIRIREV